MCGIAAVISPTAIEKQVIKSMTDVISHRGPDGEGHESFFEGRIWFGHRRLSIIDLSEAGHQPMSYMNGRYWITYNGEVYNYLEIRQELEQEGYRFQSHTDTEVIMAAYHRWGADCLHKFNGMWAFVILDVETKKIFIARDRFGVKPLYYTTIAGRGVAFASEIKQLLACPGVSRIASEKYFRQFIAVGAIEHTPETAFANIIRFPASHYCEFSIDSFTISPKQYWQLIPNCSDEEFSEKQSKEYENRYYELLHDAVRLRLRADVRVGSALSGGLDSSSVVYIVNELLRQEKGTAEQQETFSSIYTSSSAVRSADESRFIEEVATVLGVHSNRIEPTDLNMMAEHRKMIYHFDTPPNNTMMSSWHTYKLVRERGITVTLDGQGADEQLAGYLEYLTPYFSTLRSDIIAEAKSFSDIPGAGKKIAKTLAVRYLGEKNPLLQWYFRQKNINIIGSGKHLNEILVADITGNIQSLLHYGDRGSMAFSVESRMPFMDYRLAELLASVPAVYKMHQGWTKYLARAAFNGKLPSNITWRRDKIGWAIPEQAWFSGEAGDWALGLLNQSDFVKSLQVHIPSSKEEFIQNLPFSLRLFNIAVWHNVFML